MENGEKISSELELCEIYGLAGLRTDYDYLKTFGIIMRGFKEYLEASNASAELQRILNVSKSRAILKRVRWASQANGNFHEYSERYYIGDQYRYYINMTD